MTTEIKVENIKCGGCISSIKNALLKFPHINEVDIPPTLDTVILQSNLPLDKSEIIQLLNNLGYPETGNNSVLRKAKSYVSCTLGKIN